MSNSNSTGRKKMGPLLKVTKRLNLNFIKSTESQFKQIMDSFDSHHQSQELQIEHNYFNDTVNMQTDIKVNSNHQSPARRLIVRNMNSSKQMESSQKTLGTSLSKKVFNFSKGLNEYGLGQVKVHNFPVLERPRSNRSQMTPIDLPKRDLELYDFPEGDLSPQEWLAKCLSSPPPHAQCPVFVNGDYRWMDARVFGWNQDTKKFNVEVLETGQVKEILRLSLRFRWQDNEAFQRRLSDCRKRQKVHEEEMRFMNYVDSISDQYVSAIPSQQKIKQLCRITNNKNSTKMLSILKESSSLFIRMMKKCYVLKEMQDVANKTYFNQLRIKIRHQSKYQIPKINGKVCKSRKETEFIKKTMSDTFIVTKKQVIHMLFQFNNRCSRFENDSFSLIDCRKQTYPVLLEEFDQIVTQLQQKDQVVLQKHWRDYLISDIQDSLTEVYRLYGPYLSEYLGSELHRIIIRVDFMYAQKLKDLLLRSLDLYANFLTGFSMNPLSTTKIQGRGLIKISIYLNGILKMRKKSKRKETVNTMNKSVYIDDDLEDMIVIDPPFTAIKETFMNPFSAIVESVRACSSLETDTVPLLKRPGRLALEFEASTLQRYEEIGLQHLHSEFNVASNLSTRFKEFNFLMQPLQGNNKLIAEILGVDPRDNPLLSQLSQDKVGKALLGYLDSIKTIRELCSDELVTGLFVINTLTLKQQLVLKAQENLSALMQKVCEIIRDNIAQVQKQYQAVYERTTGVPQNEIELMELKQFVDQKDTILKRLSSDTMLVKTYLTLFEANFLPFDDKMTEEYYILQQWPEEVRLSIKEGSKLINQQESKFIENLDQQKSAFSRIYLKIQESFKWVRKFNSYAKMKEYMADIMTLRDYFDQAQQQVKSFNDREQLFKLPISHYDDLTLIYNDFTPYRSLWENAYEFDIERHMILNSPFTKLIFTNIQKNIAKFINESMRLSKTFSSLDDDIALSVSREYRSDIDQLREKIWVVEQLTIEAFAKKPSLWKELFKDCRIREIEPNEDMTLAILISNQILEMREIVEESSRKADKQWNLEKKLNEMLDRMKEIKIEVQLFKNSGTYIFKSVDEIQLVMDEQLNILMMMKASPYIRGCLSKAYQLEYKIVLIQDTIEGGIKCQRTWMYLEPIFSSDDIKKKLALEKQKFDSVDKNWRHQIAIFHREPYLWDAIESDKLKNEFEQSNKVLDQIQKSLSDYLESKRRYFPRFYFLSDEELLEILAQTKDPSTVQKHIGKCFEAINFLQFNEKQEVLAIESQEKEQIQLIRSVDVNEGEKKGNIERWLSEIEQVMQDTIKSLCIDTFKDLYDQFKSRENWVLHWPAQCILAVNLIKWTRDAEHSILRLTDHSQRASLKLFFRELNDQLILTVDLVRKNLTPLQRITLGSLVVIDVHAKDIIHNLMVEDCQSITEFKWISQLRQYWIEDLNVGPHTGIVVMMVNAEIRYRFEYLGNTNRLVITPLTDRCYRTLIGALHLCFGGAPEGPAGTGKTETVKDLAKAIAVQCVVFNCSDGLNILAMSKFFKGLSSSGAWCSFDEFNRIDAEVLSVIAQQIFTIQTAIKQKKKTFMFDGDEIDLVNSCSINITMNPGYAGRSDLPDNLKILFRPCAMMVPDYAMIAEIYLYSVGYQRARELSIKIVASMRLCTEQLSPQDHYDFGMRALKAILTCAGNLKRQFNQSEDVICLRALMNVNLPKFTINDTPLFISITNDLFPDVNLKEQDNTILQDKLIEKCIDFKLQPEKLFLDKCYQLKETISVRHGLMCVGIAYTGKTKVIEMLAQACSGLKDNYPQYKNVFIQKLNPKSITSDQLYGKLDSDTKQWSDGVVAIILRDCMKDESLDHKWILFDGPVDAIWIENLNTVLDDNKKLCLTSGEIIKLNQQISILFEVQDLSFASPATVSRCGMVFFESQQISWLALVQSFQFNSQAEFIIENVKNVIDQSLGWTSKYGKFPVHNCSMTFTRSFLRTLNGVLSPLYQGSGSVVADLDEGIIMQSIIFSVIWSIGASLDESSRKGFNEFLQKLSTGNVHQIKNYQLELLYEIQSISIPNAGFEKFFLFDMLYKPVNNEWLQWTDSQPVFEVPKNIPYHKLLIPTNDSIRNDHFLNFYVEHKIHMLMSGQTGTGKTVNIVSQLNQNYFNAQFTNLQTAFSGQTTANQCQRAIEAKVCVRRRKGYYGPEEGKAQIVIFIDDMNMPAKEKYGAQPPIELLRQWMDYGGWYDLETKEFKYLQDIIFVAAMLPPGGGRNTPSMRYMRHFSLLYVPPFDNESLKRIFSNVFDWFLGSCNPPLIKIVTKMNQQIVRSTIWIYEQVQSVKELLPTPAKAHYIYNLRDISKIFLGLSRGCSISLYNQHSFINLWAHECMRIFSDRMITIQDQQVFERLLHKVIVNEYGSFTMKQDSIWTSFLPCIHPETQRSVSFIYNEVNDYDKLKMVCHTYLDDHNIQYPQNRMTLVFFLNAIQHIARIVRIIQTTFGHAMLIGMGGTGRSSLARLSSFIAIQNQPCDIDQRNWIEELQKLLRIVGIEGKPTTIILNDTQIIKESMVEEVCNLLNNGEVPNLFPIEERAKIIEDVIGAPSTSSPNEKYQFFVQKCKLNLHVIICMQPVGEAFRRRLRNFPSLVNCTTIDWFQSWPEEALTSTASSFFNQHFEYEADLDQREGLVRVAVEVHGKLCQVTLDYQNELRRFFYVTPMQYLQLLSTFQRLYTRQKEVVRIQIDRYETGVDKIVATEKDVDAMRLVLFELQPKLKKSTRANQELLSNLHTKQQEADQKKQICETEERDCNIKRVEANQLRNDCQIDLDGVLPLLAQAAEALERITKDDMTQLKSFTNPPASAMVVMEGLCYAFSEDTNVKSKEGKGPPSNTDFWDYSKKYLLNEKLIRRVKDFKIDQIRAMPPQKIAKLKLFAVNPLFEKDRVMNASKAAGNLSLWIRSVLETYEAVMIIEPKKAFLVTAEQKLKDAETVVVLKQKALEEVLTLLEGLQQEYEVAKVEKEKIESQVEDCQEQLARAEKLTSGLRLEKVSWMKKASEFRSDDQCIFGDTMLASATISYLGVFPMAYRDMCAGFFKERLTLMGLKYSQNFSLQHMLADPITIGYWTNQEKLPNESFSIDNAIILKNSTRWPLIIDPQMQGNTWIKQMEIGHNLIVMRPTQTVHEQQFQLENAISIGYSVLLENVGLTIDSIFEPVLQQKIVKQGNTVRLRLGDKFIDYSNDFKFYMTTKLNNPHYPPQVCVLVTMLNFQVTFEGLDDQMINIVVKMDEPAKEEQRIRNIKEFFENKNKQKATEDQILKLLYEAKGDLLNDEVLIDTLSKSKSESQDIEERLRKQEVDRETFNQIRANYKDVAKRVSNLYFVVLDLYQVEPTYSWSLEFYIQLYEKAIKESSHSKDHRSKMIIEKFQNLLYITVCRSLLEKDKFLFSFLMTLRIMSSGNTISTEHIRFCVLGATLNETHQQQPALSWMTKKIWLGLIEIQEKFPRLFSWVLSSIQCDLQFWDQFYWHNNPQDLEFPVKLPDTFNLFHRLMIVKLIRPDKFIRLAQELVVQELGKQYLEPPVFNLESLFKESDSLTPLIFILSTGADPRHEIQNLADKLNFSQKFVPLSLGQGQGENAAREIQNGAREGRWILLQNCHVAHSFMPQLEIIFEKLAQNNELNKEFRLWLTSMPSSLFPQSLLLKGIKMTYEPPRGLRNNLLRSYVSIESEDFEDCQKPRQWKALLFSLSFFHAILLERRKYGPLGWNVPYAFTSADLEISMLQLKMFLDKYVEIPWDALHYLVASTNYGGRVTDPQDRLLIEVILNDFYSVEILEEKHKFAGSSVYYVPPEGPLENYIHFIKNLPYNDPPQLFGLHTNAEIYSAILECNQLSSVVLSLLPRTTVGSSGSKSSSPDQQVKLRILAIFDKLPPQFDIKEVGRKYPLISHESLNTVLQQELIRYNRLINIVYQTLGDLSKAIDGFVIMSVYLEDIYNKVFDNLVPDEWKNFSYLSLKPLGSWITDLMDRLNFLQLWVDDGVPSTFWLSGFFFTQSFLTGVLQNYSRKNKIAIDRLRYTQHILDCFKGDKSTCYIDHLDLNLDLTKNPSEGCIIYGLYLDGARWSFEKKMLVEPENNVLFYQVPYIWLLPTHEEKIPQPNTIYECPVYKTSERQTRGGSASNYILSIDIPIQIQHTYTHWTKRGVAILTQLDE